MKRVKEHMPFMLFGMAYICALLLVVNHHWLYGGYEGLLYHSIKPLVEGDTIDLRGEMTLSPSDNELTSMLAMRYLFDGDYDRSDDIGSIRIQIQSLGDGVPVTVATIQKDGHHLVMSSANGFEESVILNDSWSSSTVQRQLLHQLYGYLAVSEEKHRDPRSGKGFLEKPMIAYRADILEMLSEEDMTELESIIGENAIAGSMMLSILVDRQGSLAGIMLDGSFGGLKLDGWCVLE